MYTIRVTPDRIHLGKFHCTRDHDGDITLQLCLALVDIAKLFEVYGPTLFLASGILDLET